MGLIDWLNVRNFQVLIDSSESFLIKVFDREFLEKRAHYARARSEMDSWAVFTSEGPDQGRCR